MFYKKPFIWLFLVGYCFIFSYANKAKAIPITKPRELTTKEIQITNDWTEHFFHYLRPELRGREIELYDTLYRREKAAINEVVNFVLYETCQEKNRNHYYFVGVKKVRRARSYNDRYPRYRYNPRSVNEELYNRQRQSRFRHEDPEIWENDYFWRQNRDYFFEGLYKDLSDAIFYARHPEIPLEEEKINHLNWAGEWNAIRRHFANFDQEQKLKDHFIPLCLSHQISDHE